MSFEVVYSYYAKIENSFDYDRENSHTFKKVYGKVEEDYSLEKLASNIMQQMARRDIFVYNLEIFEFQKKKISFKQNKADLVIKNKKFSTKTGAFEGVEEDSTPSSFSHTDLLPEEKDPYSEAANTPMPSPPSAVASQPVNLAVLHPHQKAMAEANQNKPKRILKFVTFEPPDAVSRSRFPYKFTPNKKYPVYHEKLSASGIGMIIETIDDLGGTVKVPDELFVSLDINLIGDDESPNSRRGLTDSGLNWNGVIKDSIPKLR